ncbi:MAG TPA: amidase [Kofleriaceae bacterium]|nr:amidase [Kofleriaceae bacterium]
MSELADEDAIGTADLVRRGKVSPAELVEAAIDRLERHDPELGVIVERRHDGARADLAALPDGPFRGVPIVLKDLLATIRGTPSTAGMKALAAARLPAPADSFLVRRLRAAGFVVVATTKSSELGILPTAEPTCYGPARNPWNLAHSTGGSSGGTGAAVAAGLVPIGHGNDGGGSIRIPASCCGLVGLKPSRGRISLGPSFGDLMGGLVNEHVLTRSVRDSAAVLDLLAGFEPGDPYTAPPPARPYADEVAAATRGAAPLRVGFSLHFHDTRGRRRKVEPACEAAVAATAKALEALGHHVEERDLPALGRPEYVPRFLAVWSTGVAADLDALELVLGRKLTADDVEPLTWTLATMGRAVPAPAYANAWRWLQATSRELAAPWRDLDLWLTPTLTAPPPPLGHYAPVAGDPLAPIMRAADLVPFTAPWNVTGQPAISLPMHVDAASRLPIGVQLVGAYGREDLLLRTAAQLEAAHPWRHDATRR